MSFYFPTFVSNNYSQTKIQPISKSIKHQDRFKEFYNEKVKFSKPNCKNIFHYNSEIITPEYLNNSITEKNLINKLSAVSEVNVSKSSIVESETHIGINVTDTSNLIVSAIKSTSAGLRCPIYYSKDFGNTWILNGFNTSSIIPATTTFGGGDPFFTCDADGNFFFSWISLSAKGFSNEDTLIVGMYFAKSTDKGESWQYSKDMRIAESSSLINSQNGPDYFWDKQWMTTDLSSSEFRNSVYVGFVESNPDGSYIGIRIKRKNDNSFREKTIRISDDSFVDVQFAQVEVNKIGELLCTFYGKKGSDEPPSLWFSKSIDGGVTFSNPNKITDFHLVNFSTDSKRSDTVSGVIGSRIYPCPQMSVDKGNSNFQGNIYLTFTADGISKNDKNGTNIYLTKSTDNGNNWSAPIVLNSEIKRHQFYSGTSVNNLGILSNVWYDRRSDSLNKLTNYMINFSKDGGNTFTEDFNITQKSSDFSKIGKNNNGFGVGDYNGIVMTDNFAIPVWGDGRANTGDVEIYIAKVPINDGKINSVEVNSINTNFSNFNLSPNPTSDFVNLNYNFSSNTLVKIELFNDLGEVVFSRISEGFSDGINSTNLDIKPFPSGNYNIKISPVNNPEIYVYKNFRILK